MEKSVDGYRISADHAELDVDRIHRWLSEETYWAKHRSREVVQRTIGGSLCFGAYGDDGVQVGFARVITDGALFAWLTDVFVEPEHRGRGLANALLQVAFKHPKLAMVRRWMLSTRDAQPLYRRLGFRTIAHPDRIMELLVED